MKTEIKRVLSTLVLVFVVYVSWNTYAILGLQGYRAWRDADRASVAQLAVEYDRQNRGCK